MKALASQWFFASLAGFAVCLGSSPVLAQHGHVIQVTADASGSGQLQLGWDFEGLPIARTVDSGIAGIFTGDLPGLNDAAGNGSSTFALTNGTDVDIEILSIDEGIRWIFTNGTLEASGDRALLGTMPNMHNHAVYEQTTNDASTFAEGEIAFRIVETTVVPIGYTPSAVRKLTVSNGYLSPLVNPTADHLKCQKAVAGAVRGFSAKTYQLVAKCVDAVLAHGALGKSEARALRACSLDENHGKSLVSKIAYNRQKAFNKINKKCGPLGDSSIPFTASQVQTHLGMAECRATELAGASYNQAPEMVGDVLEGAGVGDSHDVLHAFPCMKASFE